MIDAHAHFFPDRMFKAIWKFFEFVNWKIPHKGPVNELPLTLHDHGVTHYTVLNYVRRPGQAESLNAWTAEFCSSRPEALPFGTVHAADDDPWATVAPYLTDHGFLGIKLQPLVSLFGVDDPRIETTLANLEQMDKILIVHTGTAPYPNPWLGLDRLERVLEKHPDLKVVLPHMGAYQVDRAFNLLERFPRLFLDTAMIFTNTDVFETHPDVDPDLLERFSDRILFGSDFPNVPYPYQEAIDSVTRLGLSTRAEQNIFEKSARRLFGLGEVGKARP